MTTPSLGPAPPAFLTPSHVPVDAGGPADDRALLRAMERELSDAALTPADAAASSTEYFCTECLVRCESRWDIIAGPHTGHSCLPLTVALQVLPTALQQQVRHSLRGWEEAFAKPRRAQAQQLDERTAYLREQRRQKKRALVRLLDELQETERELQSAAQAKAVAACNWRYQRERMRRQVRLWRAGCQRLQQHIAAQQHQQREKEAGSGEEDAWLHGWATAARELAAVAALLEEQVAAWAEEDGAARAAVQVLQQQQQEQQRSPPPPPPPPPSSHQQEGNAKLGDAFARTGAAAPASSATLTVPSREADDKPTTAFESARATAAAAAASAPPSHLKRTQPHLAHLPSAEPLAAHQQPQQQQGPVSALPGSPHNPHHYPSLNEFMVLGEATRLAGRPSSCPPALPTAPPPAPTAPLEDRREEAAAVRAERQQRMAAKQQALQNAIQQLLSACERDATSTPTSALPKSAVTPFSPATTDAEVRETGAGEGARVTRSSSSSLASLQQQLQQELQRELEE